MTDLAGYYDTSYPPSVWTPPPPLLTVASVTPNTGVTATAVTLGIVGTGFTASSVVYFDTIPLTTTFTDSTHVSVASYTLPGTGTYQVTVHNGTDISNGRPFTVTATVGTQESSAVFEAIPVDNPPDNPPDPAP